MEKPRPRQRKYRTEADQGRPEVLLPPRPLCASCARVGLTLLFPTAPGCRPVLETDGRPVCWGESLGAVLNSSGGQ